MMRNIIVLLDLKWGVLYSDDVWLPENLTRNLSKIFASSWLTAAVDDFVNFFVLWMFILIFSLFGIISANIFLNTTVIIL